MTTTEPNNGNDKDQRPIPPPPDRGDDEPKIGTDAPESTEIPHHGVQPGVTPRTGEEDDGEDDGEDDAG